jgi:anti-sigma-K factor RskA
VPHGADSDCMTRHLAPMATRRPPHALPPRNAHGQRRRVDRNPLWRLALAALLAVVALAAAGSLLALH